MTLFNSDKLNDFLAEKLQEILSHVNRNGNGNSNNGKRNGKQQLTWEEAWQRIAEKYARYICSLEPFDFSRLKLTVDPGTRGDNTAVWLFHNGHYQEVKLKHFLSQQVKLLLEQDLRALFGLDKSEITSLFLKYYNDSLINSYIKKLIAIAPQRQEVDWDAFSQEGLDVIWTQEGFRILVSAENVILEKQHNDHNLFAIPHVATKEEYQEPEFFLSLLNRFEEDKREAFLDMLSILLSPTHSEKLIVFFTGPADGGKSIWRKILAIILGKEVVSSINISQVKENSFHLSKFLTSLVVFVDETSDSALDVAMAKKIGSRETIFVDRKFLTAIQGRVIARMIVATNNIPLIVDYSDGFVRRLWWFEFPTIKNPIPSNIILSNIRKEASSIRRFLLLRLRKIRKNGLHELTEQYLSRSRELFLLYQNTVVSFLKDLIEGKVEIPGGKYREQIEHKENEIVISSRLLWFLYNLYCDENGLAGLSKRKFEDALRKLPSRFLSFRASGPYTIKVHGKPYWGYRIHLGNGSNVSTSQNITRNPLSPKGCNGSNVCNGDSGLKAQTSKKSSPKKSSQKSITSITSITTVDSQRFQGNELVMFREKSNEKNSPEIFSPCVGSSLSFEAKQLGEEEEAVAEAETEPEPVPLEEEAAGEQEPIGEKERVCLNCVHFPIEAGHLRTGKVCKKTEELTWWDSKVCKYFEERKSKGQAVKRAKKNKIKTPEELLAKYGDKIKQVLEIMNETAKAQKRNKSKTEEERMLKLREFSTRFRGEPHCYNCDRAILKDKSWFCQLHQVFVPGLDFCDGWEPFQRRVA